MLDKALTFLQRHLDSKLKGDSVKDKVVLARVDRDFVHLELDAVTVILLGLEPDTISRPADPYRARTAGGGTARVQPEIRLNLDVLFAARFEAYDNALGHLSRIIGYFQENPVLTRQNAPALDPAIDRLRMDLVAMPLAQQNDIWNMLKIAHTPSLLYRVKMVVFQQAAVAETPRVHEPMEEVQPR